MGRRIRFISFRLSRFPFLAYRTVVRRSFPSAPTGLISAVNSETSLAHYRSPVRTDETDAPLVSVVVTCFNYEGFVVEALQSVVAQDYCRLECIVVDDASTDGSAGRIRAFLEERGKDSPIRWQFIARPSNGGQLRAALDGLDAAQGDFVLFLDADDRLLPDSIRLHVRVHLTTSVALTSSSARLINGTGQVLGRQSFASRVERFQPVDSWNVEASSPDDPAVSCELYFAADIDADQFIWCTMSGCMFRHPVLQIPDWSRVAGWRICADKLLLAWSHLVGDTVRFDAVAYDYRLHGTNSYANELGCWGWKSRANANGRHRPEVRRYMEGFRLDLARLFLSGRDRGFTSTRAENQTLRQLLGGIETPALKELADEFPAVSGEVQRMKGRSWLREKERAFRHWRRQLVAGR